MKVEIGMLLKPSEMSMEDPTERYRVTQTGCGRVYAENLRTGEIAELNESEDDVLYYYNIVKNKRKKEAKTEEADKEM